MPGIPPKGPMSAVGVGASNQVIIDRHQQEMKQKLGGNSERLEQLQQVRMRELRQQRKERLAQEERLRQQEVRERTRRQLRLEATRGEGGLIDTTG